jgi:Integrase core domain
MSSEKAILFWSIEDAKIKLDAWRADYNTARPHSGGYSSSTYFSRSAETKRLTGFGVVFCLYQIATIDCSAAGWRWISFTAGPNALRATPGIRATPRPEAAAAAIPKKLPCSSVIRDGTRPRLLNTFSTHASYSSGRRRFVRSGRKAAKSSPRDPALGKRSSRRHRIQHISYHTLLSLADLT